VTVAGSRELKLGTRGSQLALWQANAVAARIAGNGGPRCHVVVIKTSGDRLQDAPLSTAGGKRLFVKEIEEALLRDEIDLAVHSSKDMPVVLAEGLTIAGVLPREDPLDCVVLAAARQAPSSNASDAIALTGVGSVERLVTILGQSPTIGTGSVRRIAQLRRLLPGARFESIRGNLDTRLRKLDDGQHDALVLAAAGLRRLGFATRISLALPVDACVPAPGQGIVAVECRSGDDDVRTVIESIDDARSGAALRAERAVVEVLGAGCQTPVGALARPIDAYGLELIAAVVSLDGSRAVRAGARGTLDEATSIGAAVGAQLIDQGAAEILAEAQRVQGVQPAEQP